jgi:hypothetical protein
MYKAFKPKNKLLISGRFWTSSCYDNSDQLLQYIDVGQVGLENYLLSFPMTSRRTKIVFVCGLGIRFRETNSCSPKQANKLDFNFP